MEENILIILKRRNGNITDKLSQIQYAFRQIKVHFFPQFSILPIADKGFRAAFGKRSASVLGFCHNVCLRRVDHSLPGARLKTGLNLGPGKLNLLKRQPFIFSNY